MAFPLVELNILEITYVGTALGQRVINRWDYRTLAVPVGSTVTSQQLLAAFQLRWRGSIRNILSTEFVGIRFECRSISHGIFSPGPGPGPAIRVYHPFYDELAATAVLDDGFVVGDSLPTFASYSVQKRTGFRGRTRRGSSHFSPLVEADTEPSGNHLTVAAAGNYQGQLNTFNANLVAGLAVGTNFVFSLYSAQENAVAGGGAGSANVYTFPITSYTGKAYLGSQISRKAKSATA